MKTGEGTLSEEQYDFALEDQEEYGKLLVRLVDGSTIKGTIESTKKLADEANDQDRFFVLHDAVCRFADGKGSRQKVIYVNKDHVVWSIPS